MLQHTHPMVRCLWCTRALVILTVVLTGCTSVPSRPPVTTEQIVQMSLDGVPAADIVQKMRDAGTVYRLSGSQLARLKSQGVPDEVLDYMQDTYLALERARGADYYWGGAYAWGPYPYGYWGPPGYWWPYWGYYPPPPPRLKPRPPAPPSGAHPAPTSPRPSIGRPSATQAEPWRQQRN
jgi:hypothetical protein